MKTTALSLGRWILLAAILAVLGGLMVVGRRRGTALYRWRIGLWVFALTLMGGDMVLASPSIKSSDAATFDNSGAVDQPQPDEVIPECYKPMVMCYQEVAPEPPQKDPPGDGEPKDDGDGDDDGDDPVDTGPPVVMPTCYAPMPPPPMPTCYEPMPVELPDEPES